ncbi:MAG: TIGR02302 family protein, partial [Bosea sp. (in: a-proteobacteria)]
MTGDGGQTRKPSQDPIQQKLDRLVSGSRAALAWEKLWPLLWAPLGVVLLFAAVSLFGLWDVVPWQGHVAGMALFGAALIASLWPLLRWRWPSRQAGVQRLDATGEVAHRPAAAMEDSLSVGAADPVTEALWKAHLARQRKAVEALNVVPPAPRMAMLDRRALRAVPVLAAIAGLFVAGPETAERLASGFAWHGPRAAAPLLRIDAWVDPPSYTRLPPVMLDFANPASTTLRVPEKSTIVVRIVGKTDLAVVTSGKLEPVAVAPDAAKPATAATANPPAAATQTVETRLLLTGDSTLKLGGNDALPTQFSFQAIPDRKPEVSFVEPPRAQPGERGALGVIYRARDDYGLASVDIEAERVGDGAKGRSLVDAPKQALTVPVADEETKGNVDFSAHPWAGGRVKLVIVARDEAGQEGRSEAREIVLPQRSFTNPLAKALVEQRRRLSMDVEQRSRVQLAMDALLIEPARFSKAPGTYLGLRMIGDRLRNARNDEALKDVTELMWAMALQLEDGGLSDAERELRAAQERLQTALENGASQEEIKKLTEELRRAMDKFMRELAQRMERQQQDGNRDMARLPENFRTVTPQELQNLLNRIEELSKQGDMAEAQRLMEQLRQMLENLQMARPGQNDQRQRDMNQALGELDQMTRDQQALRDETFKRDQNRRDRAQQRRRQGEQQARPGQQGQRQQGQRPQQGQRGQQPQQPGEQGDQGEDGQDGQDGEGQEGQEGQQGQGQMGQGGQGQSLSQRQQALRERLEQLQRRMRGMGQPGGGLGEA